MMRFVSIRCWLCFGLTFSTASQAYELATHARATMEAFNQSTLQLGPTRLQDLGIASLKYSVLGSQYYQVTNGIVESRNTFPFDYDREKMPGVARPSGDDQIPYRVSGWLMRGSVREDDSADVAGVVFADEVEPQDDPFTNFNRWCNHFFDPLTYAKLSDPHAMPLCTGDAYASAPVWASGANDPFQSTPQEMIGRRNHFTLYDARDAMWRALTGMDRNLNVVASDGIARKAWWATTFRSLGDALHLIQDMAQPQHTRNESHGVGHAADYEKYINARARGDAAFKFAQETVNPSALPPLIYTGYPPPQFNHYSKYWSTAKGPASTASGRGLADYSNRGFFTPAANIGDSVYMTPTHDLSKYVAVSMPSAPGLTEDYLTAVVPDKYIGQDSAPIRMTRASMWDDGLMAGSLPTSRTYSLDRATYDDRAALLLPRAVGYSAGLLNYFFNGRLTISLPDSGAYAISDHSAAQGFTKIRLKLTNTTPPLVEDGVQYPQHMTGGTVVAVVKFHRNNCYRADLAGEYGAPGISVACRDRTPAQGSALLDIDDSAESVVVSAAKTLTLNARDTLDLDFDFSQSPIPLGATDLYLQVAYRGPLGSSVLPSEQDVVVVGTKDISEPTYFSYFNASDYIHIGTSVFRRVDVASSQNLLARVQPTTCVTGSTGHLTLRDECLNPFNLTMKFGFSDLSKPEVVVTDLPPRRFLRFAVLTDPASASTSTSKSASEHVLTVAVGAIGHDEGGPRDKSLLLQQGNCLPLDPIDIAPIRNQLQFDSDPPAFVYSSGALSKLRGIYGDTQVACVINGDGSAQSTDDDRYVALSTLSAGTAEVQPFPLVVSPAYLGP